MDTSPLARLPIELRELIYKYILTHEIRIKICVKKGRPTCANMRRINLNIVKTCRQIHHEARTIFYHSNTFTFITQIFPLVSNIPISIHNPAPESVSIPGKGKGPETIRHEIRRRFKAIHDWLDTPIGIEDVARLKPVRVDLGRCNLALAGRQIGEFEELLREADRRLKARFVDGGVFLGWEPF